MKFGRNNEISIEGKTCLLMGIFLLVLVLLPELALAQDDTFQKACTKVSGFFANFETILKVVSVVIVTIAIVFAGYQIAFAHKRISDVAPILIGGLLIGGAATIAAWFVGDFGEGSDCSNVASLLINSVTSSMFA